MKTTIWLDMDGTVADLYNRNNWLQELQTEQEIFYKLKPLFDMYDFIQIQREMREKVEFNIVTWTPMEATYKYHENCKSQKLEWVRTHMAYITQFFALPYGTPKQVVINDRAGIHILIDDNPEVIETWEQAGHRGELVTIERTALDILKELQEEFRD